MIRIISRDAVFSRMLCILFSGETQVTVSGRADDITDGSVCLWDEYSMGIPESVLPAFSIVITFDEELAANYDVPCVLRPFKLDEFKDYVLGLVRSGGNAGREIYLDDKTSSASIEGVTVKFSPSEYLLLRKLYDADGKLVSKEEAVSVFESEESNVLEVYVYYLRQKLKKLPRRIEIVTVRGKGYILKKGDLN